MLMLSWVGSSFPMDVLKNCYDGLKKGANCTFNVYSSGLRKVENALHIPRATLQAGIPLATTASLAWYFTRSNDDIKKFIEHVNTAKKVTLGCSLAYGTRWVMRWWDFSSLEKALQEASSPETAHYEKFRFSTWGKKSWPLALNVNNSPKNVCDQLKLDATTCDDKIYLEGKKIYRTKSITDQMIKKAINAELVQLKKDLCSVGACTDAPQVLVQCLLEMDGEISNNLSSFINISNNIDHLMQCNEYSLNNLLGKIKECSKTNWFKKCVYFPGYQFWKLEFAPYNKRATNVYCDLLKQYIRLTAIKNVADSMSWEVKPKNPGATLNVNFRHV